MPRKDGSVLNMESVVDPFDRIGQRFVKSLITDAGPQSPEAVRVCLQLIYPDSMFRKRKKTILPRRIVFF